MERRRLERLASSSTAGNHGICQVHHLLITHQYSSSARCLNLDYHASGVDLEVCERCAGISDDVRISDLHKMVWG